MKKPKIRNQGLFVASIILWISSAVTLITFTLEVSKIPEIIYILAFALLPTYCLTMAILTLLLCFKEPKDKDKDEEI